MSQTGSTIRGEIISILANLPGQRLPVEQIRYDDSLWLDLHFDSLQSLQFVFALEDHFGIIISDEELLDQEKWMSTVNTVSDFVQHQLENLKG